MRKRITSISILQCGIVTGAFYALISIPIVLIFLAMGLFTAALGAGSSGSAVGGGIGIMVMGLLAPVLYGVMGFLFGMLAALVYNLIAKVTGGLEFRVKDMDPLPGETQQSYAVTA